jgi:hypothetical protein
MYCCEHTSKDGHVEVRSAALTSFFMKQSTTLLQALQMKAATLHTIDFPGSV